MRTLTHGELRKLRISSESTFSRLKQLGWVDSYGQSLGWQYWVSQPKTEYVVLEPVEDVLEADAVRIGTKVYPLKEEDLKKLAQKQRRGGKE